MLPIQERFKNLTIAERASELGGFVLTPSVIIECLITEADPETFYQEAVRNITIRADDFFGLKAYMLEADKVIVQKNLEHSVLCGCISSETYLLVLRVVDSITSLPLNRELEIHAHEYSDNLALYNARRLLTALHHGASLVTCDPLEFTSRTDEREQIEMFGYADIFVAQSEVDGELIDANVWTLNPEALWSLMKTLEVDELCATDRAEILSLLDFSHSSSPHGSKAEVVLSLRGKTLCGSAVDEGSIDVLLRATEQAVKEYVQIDKSNVYIHLADTTANNDVVAIYLRLKLNGYRFEATVKGLNTLKCALQAYIQIINAVLKRWN